MEKELRELCESLEDEIAEVAARVRGGKMSSGDLEYVDKLTHAVKSIKTILAMEESGYSGHYDDRYADRYGDRSYRRRDRMGRYV